MTSQNTIYIAEPIFSEHLQKYDSELTFPPIKKIGITTNHPQRREKELLGTISPVKIAIVKAWTNVDAKEIESMLHTILDNSRLDGEYFWDGNETLVDSISNFIKKYHPEAKEINISNDSDVKAASAAANNISIKRIDSEVVPFLKELGIDYNIINNEKTVRFRLDDYSLRISSKTSGRYTLTIWSKNKSTEQALHDFKGSQELAAHSSEDSDRRARIPLAKLEQILDAIKEYKNSNIKLKM